MILRGTMLLSMIFPPATKEIWKGEIIYERRDLGLLAISLEITLLLTLHIFIDLIKLVNSNKKREILGYEQ